MSDIRQKEKGFTLIELAIAMVIVALLVSFATVAFSGLLRRGFEDKTFDGMEIVADAIAVYAQRHMRVPCPADPTGVAGGSTEPFGAERGSGAAGNVFGTCRTIADAEGIIPFATLGLPQKLAKDRFGNFITYRVSVSSAEEPVISSARPINNWCMTRPYWNVFYDDNFDGSNDASDNNGNLDAGETRYPNLAKAAFCCGTWGAGGLPDVSGDVQIQGSFGALPNLSRLVNDAVTGTAIGATVDEYRDSTAAPPTYAELANPVGGGGIDFSVPPMFPAYILVSHGQNGAGAYDSQSGVRPSTAGMTAQEIENVDSDVNYFASDRTSPVNPGGANPTLFRPDIDDIVFWEMPSQVLGRIGGVSCTRP